MGAESVGKFEVSNSRRGRSRPLALTHSSRRHVAGCISPARTWQNTKSRTKGPTLGVTQTAGGLTSDLKIRSANRARNKPRCGPAGGGIRTRKGFRPEACETSAFAIFATPAVLTVTNHGHG